MSICPCQQQLANPKLYEQCCQPLHNGQPASSYEQLMRSRYSAFALGLNEYLAKTWHSSTCPAQLDVAADDQWLKLEIVATTANTVHFKAYGRDADGFFCLEENSNFTEENGQKVYVNGDVRMDAFQQERNQPCLCGSGKKAKKCCG